MELTKDELILALTLGKNQKEIAQQFQVGIWKIEKLIKEWKLHGIKELYKVDLSKLDNSLPEFMYFAGLIATDGNIRKTTNTIQIRLVGLNSKKLLENIIEIFSFKTSVMEYKLNQFDLIITSKYLKEQLLKEGLTDNNKTFNLQFPENFKSEECAKMYWRGIIDGDGRIRYNFDSNGFIKIQTISLYTASSDFIKSCVSYLNEKFNLKLEVKTFKNKPHIIGFDINNQKDCEEFLDWIYGYDLKLKLEHKYLPYSLKKMMI